MDMNVTSPCNTHYVLLLYHKECNNVGNETPRRIQGFLIRCLDYSRPFLNLYLQPYFATQQKYPEPRHNFEPTDLYSLAQQLSSNFKIGARQAPPPLYGV